MDGQAWYSAAQASSVAGCTFGVTCLQTMFRKLGLDSIWVPFVLSVIFVCVFIADWTKMTWAASLVVMLVNVAVVFLAAIGANETAANIKEPPKTTAEANAAKPNEWIRSYFR
jgi:hypothetical protein